MDDINYRRYKRIIEARKWNNRLLWTIGYVAMVFVLFNVIVYIGKNYSAQIFICSLLVMILIDVLGIFYYIYIQFMAKGYLCNKCGKIFVVGFWKAAYKDARMINNRHDISEFVRVGFVEEENKKNSWLYREFIVKCPYCNERLFWMDSQIEFDDKVLRDIDGRL